ncbi:MAG: hypothetical protein QXV97_05830 [Candidatus Caldarchaeum sp.]
MEVKVLRHIESKGLKTDRSIVLRSLDMRYYGQGHELGVRVGKPFKASETISSFENLHEAVYGFKHSGESVEVTAARLSVIIPRTKLNMPKPRNREANLKTAERKAHFGEWLDTPVYSRELLPAGFSLEGPAIIEEYDSTTVVPPGWKVKVDETGSILIY